jgi:Spy/CpxP family protein refolding chaperone
MRKLLITIAFGATMVATQATAQEAAPPPPQGTAPVPVGEGRHHRGGWAQQDMTRAQAQQMADSMFQRFDLNHDGTVTRQEAQQAASQFGFGAERAERQIDRIFGDAQSLTLQQFEAQSLARFDRDDLNHDGVVTAAERQQERAQLKAERAGQNPGQQ